jgi:pimeloyl-ACP methyl ester carboxylesterase
VPPQIVVGVDQRDRGADLGRDQERFTRFLAEELVPFIDHEFRTSGFRTLIGHSLGGRFAVMTMCRTPGVFPAVIAISGAGGDSTSAGAVTACLRQAFASDSGRVRQLVLSAGDREERTLAGINRIRDILAGAAPAQWRWTVIPAPALGHTGAPLAAIPPGIRFVNDGAVWEMPTAAADSVLAGAGDPDATIAAFQADVSARVGSAVSPSRKWLLAAAHAYAKRSDIDRAERAVKRVIEAYPEDLEAYGMLSDLALRRHDPAAARRALETARRMLDRLEVFDVYDKERKRVIIENALAGLTR